MRKTLALSTLVMLFGSGVAVADEGMWTFNGFPSAEVKKKYGFEPTPEWLEHVRLSSARLARGCSGSFVSAQGLVLTNHHCVSRCVEDLSTSKQDFIRDGFYAKAQGDERRCPGVEINRLEQISDVTSRVTAATRGLQGAKFTEAFKAESARIEKECASSDELRCEVVTLYHGGRYDLYRYKRYQDVRLVWAPEMSIAFFGGDPDNFTFPRYDLDASFLRVYENGKPAELKHHLTWSAEGPKEGDLSFVSGHPGKTSRLLTVAQYEALRDRVIPELRVYNSELRGLLIGFQARGPEQKRISNGRLFGVENTLKAAAGRHKALLDKEFFASKVAAEKRLRDAVARDPAKQKEFGAAWDEIAQAQKLYEQFRPEHLYLSQGLGFRSALFDHAETLVRAPVELAKPNEQRLKEYTDASFPATRQQLLSPAPIYPELEIEMLTWSLTKMRAELGADHPVVRKVLAKRTPRAAATAAVRGSKLLNPKSREAILKGGAEAVAASKDSMIELARLVDPDTRAVRKRYEDEIESRLRKNGELVAKAHFAVNGTNTYPDATFTLRLSYGQVKGYTEATGKKVPAMTHFAGAFERHTPNAEPYALPDSWLKAKPRLDLSTPFNLVSTNDIIGGNSGSPLVSARGEVIGLIFDSNIEGLGGDFGYDGTVQRAVSVHSSAILHSLDRIYGAKRLLEELRPTTGSSTSTGAR